MPNICYFTPLYYVRPSWARLTAGCQAGNTQSRIQDSSPLVDWSHRWWSTGKRARDSWPAWWWPSLFAYSRCLRWVWPRPLFSINAHASSSTWRRASLWWVKPSARIFVIFSNTNSSYPTTRKILLISRVACYHWTSQRVNSKLHAALEKRSFDCSLQIKELLRPHAYALDPGSLDVPSFDGNILGLKSYSNNRRQ